MNKKINISTVMLVMHVVIVFILGFSLGMAMGLSVLE